MHTITIYYQQGRKKKETALYKSNYKKNVDISTQLTHGSHWYCNQSTQSPTGSPAEHTGLIRKLKSLTGNWHLMRLSFLLWLLRLKIDCLVIVKIEWSMDLKIAYVRWYFTLLMNCCMVRHRGFQAGFKLLFTTSVLQIGIQPPFSAALEIFKKGSCKSRLWYWVKQNLK